MKKLNVQVYEGTPNGGSVTQDNNNLFVQGDIDYGTGGGTIVRSLTSVKNTRGQELTPQFEQVQSDWNQADNTKPDYIKNKPAIGGAVVIDAISINPMDYEVELTQEDYDIMVESFHGGNPVMLRIEADGFYSMVVLDDTVNFYCLYNESGPVMMKIVVQGS